MRIQMLTLMAGPGGVRDVGAVYDVDEAEARALLEGGFAVPAAEEASPPEEEAAGEAPPRRRRARAKDR